MMSGEPLLPFTRNVGARCGRSTSSTTGGRCRRPLLPRAPPLGLRHHWLTSTDLAAARDLNDRMRAGLDDSDPDRHSSLNQRFPGSDGRAHLGCQARCPHPVDDAAPREVARGRGTARPASWMSFRPRLLVLCRPDHRRPADCGSCPSPARPPSARTCSGRRARVCCPYRWTWEGTHPSSCSRTPTWTRQRPCSPSSGTSGRRARPPTGSSCSGRSRRSSRGGLASGSRRCASAGERTRVRRSVR